MKMYNVINTETKKAVKVRLSIKEACKEISKLRAKGIPADLEFAGRSIFNRG